MKLYFGNAITTVTTLMLFALLGLIGWSVWGRTSIQYWGRRSIQYWGRRSTVLLVFGLVICCFAATMKKQAAIVPKISRKEGLLIKR